MIQIEQNIAEAANNIGDYLSLYEVDREGFGEVMHDICTVIDFDLADKSIVEISLVRAHLVYICEQMAHIAHPVLYSLNYLTNKYIELSDNYITEIIYNENSINGSPRDGQDDNTEQA